MLPAHRGTCDFLVPQLVFYIFTSETVKPEFQAFDVTTASQHWVLQSRVARKPKLPMGTSNKLNHLKMNFYCIYLPLFLLSPTFSEQRECGIVGTTVLEIKARDCTGEVVLVKSGNGQLRRGEIGNRAWEHRYACVCTSTWNI